MPGRPLPADVRLDPVRRVLVRALLAVHGAHEQKPVHGLPKWKDHPPEPDDFKDWHRRTQARYEIPYLPSKLHLRLATPLSST